MSLKERKLNLKPWFRKGILTSVNNKNKTYRKYCRAKDKNGKLECTFFLNNIETFLTILSSLSPVFYLKQKINIDSLGGN